MHNLVTNLAQLATITVTYFPDIEVLTRQLRMLPGESLKIIVDNSTEPVQKERIKAVIESLSNARVLSLTQNNGLAVAINLGVVEAMNAGCQWVLLLDQDSVPVADAAQVLLQSWIDLRSNGIQVGAVGPMLRDTASGVDHGFHVVRLGLWLREHPCNDANPFPVNSINGSGTLLAIEDFRKLGGLDESLFIDHVDTEWSFRMQAAGYCLYAVPRAQFHHRMGEATTRIWLLGWRAWPWRSPKRHYYLFRNAVILMRYHHVPMSWKFWAVLKLMLTFAITIACGRRRIAQAKHMLRGASERCEKQSDDKE